MEVIGQIERIRVPLTQLQNSLNTAARTRPEYNLCAALLSDAIHCLDDAQDLAESHHLEMPDGKAVF